MYGSPPTPPSKDLNLPYPAAGSFGGQRAEDADSDLIRRQHQQQQMSIGLLRYRSAPSSLLGEACEDFAPVRASSPETETMFTRFLAPDLRDDAPDKASGGSATLAQGGSHFLPPPSSAQEVNGQHSRGFSSASQMIFQQQQQQMPNCSAESSFPVAVGSLAMETEQIKNSSSNLIRQSSSPAGLFSHLTMDNGYGVMRGMGGFMMDGSNRSKGQLNFSSRQSSVMSQISEMENEEMEGSSTKEDSNSCRTYISGFPVTSWDDSSLFNSSFLGLKGGGDGEVKMVAGLSSMEHQEGDVRNQASSLQPHLSLPKNSSTMFSIEKFLQIHDAVPCKIRAKRGCATHPRSIAERVRRTRISERMKKLQDLVPNMDKQTNTADMLDLAVDYIKDLQKQVKSLSESRASCSCSASRQKPM
ncbi:hypothetical protein Cni_G21121 [Canna indica]|uniref:BHLH domain-containing protein n=1 Tax=Canna indica TaxID=4628 RepID=A0AAQ3KPM0_9LILI|nr:hypothetical protein Cni_G21121 [Canna indica]